MAIGCERPQRCNYGDSSRPWAQLVVLCLIALIAGKSVAGESSRDEIAKAPFGVLPGSEAAELYTLRSRQGMQARIATYGGIVVSLTAPDRHGRYADVVLGYDTLAGYLKSSPYFGALIGRYGNRIAGGRFTLNGTTYTLATNDGSNTLHGGRVGFDKVMWQVTGAQVT